MDEISHSIHRGPWGLSPVQVMCVFVSIATEDGGSTEGSLLLRKIAHNHSAVVLIYNWCTSTYENWIFGCHGNIYIYTHIVTMTSDSNIYILNDTTTGLR